MPKSRKQRKNKKSSSRSSRAHATEVALPKAPVDGSKSDSHAVSAQKSKRRRFSILHKLYANEAQALYQLVTVSPFFVASWVAGGLALDEIVTFGIISSAILVSYYLLDLERQEKILFAQELRLIGSAVLVILVGWFYHETKLGLPAILFALSLVIHQLGDRLQFENPRTIVIKCSALVVRMIVLSLLGVLSQRYKVSTTLVWEYGVFGFVPGLALAGGYVARYTQVFLNAGWQRSSQKTDKKGDVVCRPAGVTRLFSALFVLGPAIPCISVPFGLFPAPFLACAISFYFIPDILEAYLKAETPDGLTAVKAATVAFGLTGIVFLAGVISAMGIM